MKMAKIISLLGVFVMTGILIYAFAFGDFSTEGKILLGMPWGIVSLVDLYIGFILFSLWIIYREKSLLTAIIWVFFMLTLGFFTGSLYVFITAKKSHGNWHEFWLGKNARE